MEKQQKEIKYSYSRLECYDQCPLRYWLKYIEGHYASTGSVALEFGTAVHAVEEEIGNSIKAGEPIDYDRIKGDFAAKCAEIQGRYPGPFAELDKSGRTYADKINYYMNEGIYRLERFMQANPNLEIVGTEIPFNFKYQGNQLFRGFIDRVLRDRSTGKYIVQDIKTYAVPLKDEPGDRDPHLVTPLQFVVYCIAVCQDFHCEPQDIVCQYDLPLCDKTQTAGTKGFIERGCDKLNKLFERIDAGEWEPKQTPLCHWCEFCGSNECAGDNTKYLCPYFSHWTRERKDFSKENEWMGMENHKAIFEAYSEKVRKAREANR